MTHLLIVSTWDYPSYRLTCKAFRSLQGSCGFLTREKLSKEVSKKDLAWCDILLIVRGDDILSQFLAKKCKKLGKLVFLTLDDDLLNISMPGQSPILVKENHKSLDTILKMVNRIFVPSPYLGEKYGRNYPLKFHILGSILDDSDYMNDVINIDSSIIKIVYPAHPGHKLFFEKYISPIVEELHRRHKGQFSFTFIGPKILLDQADVPVEYLPTMPFDEYEAFMKVHPFHIGIAPLDDTESCRCKYYNKYIEFTKYRILGIYSDIIPYKYIVQDGVNGYMVENTEAGWLGALSRAIDQISSRDTLINQAIDVLKVKNSLNTFAASLQREVPELSTFKSPSLKKRFFIFPNMKVLEILLRIRNKGITLLNRA